MKFVVNKRADFIKPIDMGVFFERQTRKNLIETSEEVTSKIWDYFNSVLEESGK